MSHLRILMGLEVHMLLRCVHDYCLDILPSTYQNDVELFLRKQYQSFDNRRKIFEKNEPELESQAHCHLLLTIFGFTNNIP
jgi:hypothetical protein